MGPIHPTASDKRTGLEVGIVTVVDDVVDEFLGGGGSPSPYLESQFDVGRQWSQ